MNTFLVILLIAAMVMVVVSLVRGVVAFLKSSKEDLYSDHQGDGPTDMQLLQNKAMFARVKWQAIAIVIIAVLLASAS